MSTKQTEALKLALEALENNVGEYRVDGANPNDLQNFDMKVRTNGGPLHTVPLYTHPAPAQQPLTDDRYINAMSALTHLLMVHEGRDNSTAKEIARQMSEHGITGSKEGGAA